MVNYHQIFLDLEKLIDGDVLCDSKILKKYSKDASLFTIRPQIVVCPKDRFDIQAIVRYIKNLKESIHTPGGVYDEREIEFLKKLSLTPRAAGTDMTGGPLNDSIILDTTKYMHKIFVKNFVSENFSIECEPGVYYRNLEKFLDKYGLMYPSYPASKDLCCIGGIVSNNSSGEKTLLYGSTNEWVQEIEMVLSDGSIFTFKKMTFKEVKEFLENDNDQTPKIVKNIFSEICVMVEENKELVQQDKPKVSKNSSGYNLWDIIDWKNETVDMCKLIVGSQGTLGIVTKVNLRLTPKQPFSQMLTVFLPDLKELTSLVGEISKYSPESIETFDDHTFKIAIKFLPSIIWKLKGSIWQLGTSFLPEFFMGLTGGVPKLILLAEFTGNTQSEANKKAYKCFQQIKKFNYKTRLAKNELDVQKYWLFRRESFNLLRSKLKGLRTAPFVEDIIVPVEHMESFIEEMQAILDKYKYIYTVAGHAGNGNFHIIPLMKLSSFEEIETIKKTNQEIFSLVQKYRGSLSAEHNDGLVRTPYLHFMFSDRMLSLFKQVKNIWDPQNIFNPNKKVGGSITENYKNIELQK